MKFTVEREHLLKPLQQVSGPLGGRPTLPILGNLLLQVADGALFRQHVNRVRELFLAGKIAKCIGWQVYQSFEGLPFGEKTIAADYILIQDGTEDFNFPADYNRRTTK